MAEKDHPDTFLAADLDVKASETITSDEQNNRNEDSLQKTADHKNTANLESNLEKELHEIETDFSTLSNNFKKRRLSKNEMDFLETELNLDINSIADADFDIHLQKLMADNVTHTDHIEKKQNGLEASVGEVKSSDDKGDRNFEEKQTVEEPQKAKDEIVDTPQTQQHKERNGGKVNNETNGTREAATDLGKSTKKSNAITSTTTDTYKGVSIPANSELLKSSETQSVLQAYRDLMQDPGRTNMKEVNHVNAQLSALPLLLTAPDHLSFNVQMLINTLPVLDNLATQILRIIAKGPYQKIMELVSNRESYTGIAFGNLVELFETTKRIYNSEESPFFTVENITFGLWKYGQQAPLFLKGREDTIEGTLRKVNLSTFLLATLGLIDLGFFFLNEAFLDVFCPPQNLEPSESLSLLRDKSLLDVLRKENRSVKAQRNQTKFLKAQAILYLELKTQAYISAIELGDRSKEDIIHDLFPDNMDEILLRRKDPFYEAAGIKLERNSALFTPAELDFLSRCDFRKQTLLNSEADSSLMEKYEWIKFLNDLLEYVSKNVGFLIWGPKGKLSSELNRLNTLISAETTLDKANQGSADSYASPSEEEGGSEDAKKRKIEDPHEQRGTDTNNDSMTDTSSKNKGTKRPRANRPSTFRRIWTAEEEETLKKGLMQKGTHWTAILELYGPGGTINENLKNRSSLQLKDKARNWKIYYTKNKLPIPSYLQKAIGDNDKYKRAATGADPLKRPGTGFRPTEFVSTEPSEYNEMFSGLLPEAKGEDKMGSGSHEEVVTSELKDLVAEAFK
ncbi:hypothetical protein PMKS-003337 [Pichia membranifaciens]|uniref:Myb-like domain-containing protein n=1 Tax=Pichia membranifaciens TaxID=4926 RepID=A0A1Q2YJW1_9ASCO|nr:hypothetical protein PMKS-003337 [Pichia membranifaciens]